MTDLHSDRPLEAQLATARMLLAQFAAQIEEHDGMNREQKRSARGKDLASRIGGLREGLAKWMTIAADLEAALSPRIGPYRVQLSRRKGYRKPENTVVVARPSRWGNPVRIVPVHKSGPFDLERDGVGFIGQNTDLEGARRSAVARYRDLLLNHPHLVPVTIQQIRAELAGKNLACWCPLEHPCHADVLLELANGDDNA